MKIKRVENIVTRVGVILLAVMTFVGFLFVFDVVYKLDIFQTDKGKDAFGVLCAILCILILSCTLVSAMLNISRIANSIESISEKFKSNIPDQPQEK